MPIIESAGGSPGIGDHCRHFPSAFVRCFRRGRNSARKPGPRKEAKNERDADSTGPRFAGGNEISRRAQNCSSRAVGRFGILINVTITKAQIAQMIFFSFFQKTVPLTTEMMIKIPRSLFLKNFTS